MSVCPPLPFSLNILADLQNMFCLSFMANAFIAGTVTAVVAGATGFFVVLRRSAFTAHAFSEIGFAGASGAILLNSPSFPPLAGLLTGSILGAFAIAALARRATNRDTQIGIVLAFALGLGLLFISAYHAFSTAAISVLFGEIVGVSGDQVNQTIVSSAVILLALGFLYRPLLFASLDEDVAEAKGMPMLALGVAFMVIVAAAVSFAVEVTGVLLIFSLMVTPAATAMYLSKKPRLAILTSVGIALGATWMGIFIAYYSPYPVSFFITAIVFTLYLAVRGGRALFTRTARTPLAAPDRDGSLTGQR